ncbi:hypothetical protein BOTBODRAFT_106575 [Botryobasidium botryosum FD-172 SS1]|uniref:Phosphoacetylglucosamine mutase n=1 Tax=Botryobasidium botryosum (strain FD-172 SS1) TaxID=930990 RepID=A0A067MML2_BOTB1|nr:hypothetical protein BOTBODRAFT_106575 [Botryobasidium botryosum FD-172 SS1]
MSLPVEALARYSDLHPKLSYEKFHYGTAGFRMAGSLLDSVMFRVGVLAAIRSKRLEGKTIGVMVTASHNPPVDNGVKLVDPRGEMLEASWERHATVLANTTSTDEFIDAVDKLVKTYKINLDHPANVLYARDTRPSGVELVAALEDGLKAMGANGRNEGVQTTPILHYLVRCVNTKGTPEAYGEDTVEGYIKSTADAFKKLIAGKPAPPPLVVDCANGVGYVALKQFAEYLGPAITFIPMNNDLENAAALNSDAGADYVKTNQKFPPSIAPVLAPGQRACSLDGDADRLIYYYLNSRKQFRLLDGDKIAALVAGFITDLVKGAGLEGQIDVGLVQTAYANGASTKYLEKRLPVACVPTGVKHLHRAALRYGVGVYFEANGHGTVVFSPATYEVLASYQPSTPTQATYLEYLNLLPKLINQTIGDALSDMLLVEAVLAHKHYTALEWDSIYIDLPNRLLKVVVPNRNIFQTEDAERRLVHPEGMQKLIDDHVKKFESGRAFVRPSGTENVVRVYAEASDQGQADQIALKIAGIIYDETGGDPFERPGEFL